MKKYAIVSQGVVENVVLWDGSSPCDAIPIDAILLPDTSNVCPGYTYDEANFVAPPEPVAPTFT